MRRPRMCRVSLSSLLVGSPLGKLPLSYVPKGEGALVLAVVGVSGPDPDGSALTWVVWIRIRIGNPDPYLGGQKRHTKIEKSCEISCFEMLNVFF
jgi:hypothetical protein